MLTPQPWFLICDPMDCIPPGSRLQDFLGKNTEVGCLFLLKKEKKNYINIFKEDILIRKMDILFNLKSCSENKLTPNYDIDGCIVNIFCRELRSKLENEFFFLFFIWNQFERHSQDALSPFPAGPSQPAWENSVQMKWGPFWCPLPDSFENYFASIMMDTLCLKWWMGSIWKRMTWNLKNDTSAGGQTFFF